MKTRYALFLLFFITLFTNAQVSQVTDINPGDLDANPENLFAFDDQLFFVAVTENGVRRLHSYNSATDQTTVVTNDEIENSAGNGITLNQQEIIGNILYVDLSYDFQRYLHRYDTTSQQLELIPNISPRLLVNYNDQLYISGEVTDDIGVELYRYNETTSMIERIGDINDTAGRSSAPDNFKVFQDRLYFTADAITTGRELYFYEDMLGTIGRITDLNQTNVADGDSAPNDLTIYNNELYFSAFDGVLGQELYKYDPVIESVVRVADINPGANSSFVKELYVHNNKLYFQASTSGFSGGEFYSYDAATDQTVLVRDINATGGSQPENFLSFNNRLYFEARGQNAGLYVYNDVTDILTRLAPQGFQRLLIEDMIEFDGKLYLSGVTDNTTIGRELYVYDDTSVTLVQDIVPDFFSSNPNFFTVYNNELYFNARNAASGYEIFKLDNTTASIEDLNTHISVSHYNNALHVANHSGEIEVRIHNLAGQLLSISTQDRIETGTLVPGIYIAIISDGAQEQTLKFLK